MGNVYVDGTQVGTFTPQTKGTSGNVLVGSAIIGDFTLGFSGNVYLNSTYIGTYVSSNTPSLTDPDIRLEWYRTATSQWIDALDRCKDFTIRDGGLLNPPKLIAIFDNKDGFFTVGDNKIVFGSEFRVRIDVGNGLKKEFHGTYRRHTGERQTAEVDEVELVIDGIATKGDDDYAAKNYQSELGYTYKQMIDDFLQNTISGYDTDIRLVSYPGDPSASIYGAVTDEFNFKKSPTTLKELMEKIAEVLEYDGYIDWTKGTYWEMLFQPVGTIETDPKLQVRHPYLRAKPVIQTHDLKNYILLIGGWDNGIPFDNDSLFTEQSQTNYSCWTGYPAETTVIDDQETDTSPVYSSRDPGNWHIEVSYVDPNPADAGAILDFTKVYGSVIDASVRFSKLRAYFISKWSNGNQMQLHWLLEDENGDEIGMNDDDVIEYQEDWKMVENEVGNNVTINAEDGGWLPRGEWQYRNGSTTFDWTKIKKLTIFDPAVPGGTSKFWVDFLSFVGQYRINPIEHPAIFPIAKDESSITTYGIKVYYETDDKILSKEHYLAKRDRLLAMMNREFKTINAQMTEYHEEIRGNQTVDVSLPNYDVGGDMWEDGIWDDGVWLGTLVWRIDEVITHWSSKTKHLWIGLHLVEELIFLSDYMKATESQEALMGQFVEKAK